MGTSGGVGVFGFRVALFLLCGLQGACGDFSREPSEPPLSDDEARGLLGEIRARYRVPNPADLISSAGAQRSVLGASAPVVIEQRGDRFYANLLETEGPELSFSTDATQGFSLRERFSGVSVEARLVGARRSTGMSVDGLVVYPKAGPNGGSVVHRLTDDGTEDYIVFETPPAASEVAYEVTLSSGVAGLRLVSDTLEFLDAGGFPRLRIAPPSIVGADGRSTDASLTVSGCKVDTDGTPPWDRTPTSPGAESCEVRVAWDPANVQYPALLDPSWTTTGNMVLHRFAPSAAKLGNGNVLVTGGYGNTGAVLKQAEIYNPAGTGTWAAITDMTVARAYHTMTLRNNGEVLVTGGTNGTNAQSSIAIYRTTGTWATTGIPSMSQARDKHAATLLSNGDVLVTGGTAGNPASLAAQKFTTGNSWVSAGTMLSYKFGHTAVRLNDGKVLAAGGDAPTSELYNPTNNTWTATTTPAESRSYHGSVRLADGTVLAVGGMASTTNQSTELYNPTTQAWTRTGNLWWNHVWHTTTLLSNGKVVVIGGQGTTSRTATEIFEPTWGTWVPGPQLSSPRSSHIAVLLNSGKILIAGGLDGVGTTTLRSAALFDPATTATTTTEYKIAATAQDNAEVSLDLPTRVVEFWASVHRPTTLTGSYPLLLFLHGNHYTCGQNGTVPRIDDRNDYSDSGTCPSGYSVVNNHRGYDYLANALAARGYIVVSINANRGIGGVDGDAASGDFYLALARGRLLLKHLEKLSRWNRNVEATPASIGVSLANRLNLSQVGYLGHSRGGQGVRAAHKLYGEANSPWPAKLVTPLNVRGVFEIGPTDCGPQDDMACESGPSPIEARNTRWTVLLPQCDGDQIHMTGIRPFDRMFAQTETTVKPKSTYTVWGANHNFYNTEWQVLDDPSAVPDGEVFDCVEHRALFSRAPGTIGSPEQRQTALQPVLAFFTSNVGTTPDTWFDNVFNPELPMTFEPRVDRGYTPGLSTNMSMKLEDFVNATGTSSYGKANTHSNVNVAHVQAPELPLHDASQRGADMWWSHAGSPPYPFFQTTFTNPGSGLNLSAYQLLDIRVDRAFDSLNGESPTDFEVSLIGGNGVESARVAIGSYVNLVGPVGSNVGLDFPYIGSVRHSMLQTTRIPLSRFTGVSLGSIRAVRFTFSSSLSGRIYVANIRATKTTLVP